MSSGTWRRMTCRADADEREVATISSRLGDITVPALPEKEALASMVAEFAAAIRERRAPRTDGLAGLRVLSVLHAVSRSLADQGAPAAPGLPTLQALAG